MDSRLLMGLLGGAVFSIAPMAPAAVVSISSVASTGVYDLTNVYGTGDWAYWENNAGDNGAPLNQKAGADLIGDMSILNSTTGSSLGGTSGTKNGDNNFSFTDGTTPVSGSINEVVGLWNAPLDTEGNGLKVEVISPTADPFNIYVWAAAYAAEARLTAAVGTVTDSENFIVPAGRTGYFYTIDVTPDSVGQVVTLTLDHFADNTAIGNSNVSLAAVAVTPEPASLSLSLLGGLMMLSRRRRR